MNNKPSMVCFALSLAMVAGCLLAEAAAGTNYFVSLTGSDTNSGLDRSTAFRTVQRGVDALCAGDTLSIAPGEYLGSVCRTNLGGPNAETIIRAAIPGTVILRGDIPAPPLRKVENYRNVYEADFDSGAEIQGVNEQDTLIVLGRAANIAELDFSPGMFYHDQQAKKLYVAPPDMALPPGRRYTVAVTPGPVLELVKPQRVNLEGLTATGAGRRSAGFNLLQPTDCVIRDCRAYFNPSDGFYVSTAQEGTRNLVERCTAWANGRGFMCFCPNRGTVRDSQAFLNGNMGFWMYGGPGSSQGTTNRVENCLAWGNPIEFELKASPVQEADRCVFAGVGSENSLGRTVLNSLMGFVARAPGKEWRNNLFLSDYKSASPEAEFADLLNNDYRLQATSRFRGAGTNGIDLGPFSFKANIFYVSANGNDKADGLSVSNAWNTLSRAASNLRPGDTLYILPGRYEEELELKAGKLKASTIFIRGRGTGLVELAGSVQIEKSHNLTFERVRLTGNVAVAGGSELAFEQCSFACPGGFSARDADGLRLVHNEFFGGGKSQASLSGCKNAFLAGNIFENISGAAVAVDKQEAMLYADYNCYRLPAAAWLLGGKTHALDKLPSGFERYGTALKPGEKAAWGTGQYGRPAGNFRLNISIIARLSGPFIHAVGASSANIEWFPSRDAARKGHRVNNARVTAAWGETPECKETITIETEYFDGFSLTNLNPSTRYYVQIRSVRPSGLAPEGTAVEWNREIISFETLPADPAPKTYYVATNGNDASSGLSAVQALRTLGRAAALVRPGDTVRIAGGVYKEGLYARATGTAELPITFAAMPGERVVLDGDAAGQRHLLLSLRKSHLRFDGLILQNAVLGPSDFCIMLKGGEDIRLTRILYDGRPPPGVFRSIYSPCFIEAAGVRGLLVKNCIGMYGFGASTVSQCPGFRMENSLVVHNQIGGIGAGISPHAMRGPEDAMVFRNNIFVDCQASKVDVEVSPSAQKGAVRLENNAHFLMPQRRTERRRCLAEFAEEVVCEGGILCDPRFAGLKNSKGDITGRGGAIIGILDRPLTFTDFFATHPEFVKRGIGLNPEDFKDYNQAQKKSGTLH
ncbi:MAG: right-handed parallel beta-helix repeat-containing protein [Kiritimatiellia bacterium]